MFLETGIYPCKYLQFCLNVFGDWTIWRLFTFVQTSKNFLEFFEGRGGGGNWHEYDGYILVLFTVLCKCFWIIPNFESVHFCLSFVQSIWDWHYNLIHLSEGILSSFKPTGICMVHQGSVESLSGSSFGCWTSTLNSWTNHV